MRAVIKKGIALWEIKLELENEGYLGRIDVDEVIIYDDRGNTIVLTSDEWNEETGG